MVVPSRRARRHHEPSSRFLFPAVAATSLRGRSLQGREARMLHDRDLHRHACGFPEHPAGRSRSREHASGHDGMMRSALWTGLVDFVLPAEEMPAKLADYFLHASVIHAAKERQEPGGNRGLRRAQRPAPSTTSAATRTRRSCGAFSVPEGQVALSWQVSQKAAAKKVVPPLDGAERSSPRGIPDHGLRDSLHRSRA